ncbi:PREDICTED: MATH and LRR domain-containing protein PFE0570w [Polistes dominula]|uniref:MATH and LRR domain-containing protein PFE0570w n=1 Tax=Polistes dominula TaxID=743375 RepID=A0ABM1HUW6_POLDO|nr:PREDICTED: MATH and LRR domain-containing protein PFE0570w [Polistes dominula]
MSKTKKNSHSSEEFSSSYSSSSVSSDEEIDARDLKPMKDYLSNRRELARQLFKSVKPEKIRMMLPQALKKMDFEELEEWCASELSGMSKTRVLCILDGKPMLESSDTSESDESGPSLEIISDTEEWLTEDDNIKKEDSISGKTKLKKHKNTNKMKSQSNNKREDAGNGKFKSKTTNKDGSNNKYKEVKVKKEDEKETGKEKEADSLLDLLELEMRARAIRALIRKEDDIIPSSNETKALVKNGAIEENHVNKTRLDEINAKENCRRQLEKIISSQRMDGEEEDVVLVVQPTPTIELLSSESENDEVGTRVNQKLENERKIENATNLDNKNVITSPIEQGVKESKLVSGKDNDKKTDIITEERCNFHTSQNKNSSASSSTNVADNTVKRKRVKKKSHSKSEERPDNSSNTDNKTNECLEKKKEITSVPEEKEKLIEENISKVEKESVPSGLQSKDKVVSDEDKLADFEEIIDLDNYSDDMDDLENCDNDKNKNKDQEQTKIKDNSIAKEQKNSLVTDSNLSNSQKLKSAETWATRYYQTDDVQSVIKESKIQSEIRKRLRERQRLSKLTNSPNLNSSPSRVTEVNNDKEETKPTGSVEEYLALKQATQSNVNAGGSNVSDNSASIQEKDKCINSCNEKNAEDAEDEKIMASVNEENVDKSTAITVNNDV